MGKNSKLKIVEKKENKDARKYKEKLISLETDITNLNKELELTGQTSTLLMAVIDLGSVNKNNDEPHSIKELKTRKINVIRLLDKFENVFKEFIGYKYKMEKITEQFNTSPDFIKNDSSVINKENRKIYTSYLQKEKELDVVYHFLKSEILDVYEYFRVNVAKLYLLFSEINFTTSDEFKKTISKINFRYLEKYLENEIYQKILLFQNIRVKFSHTPDANTIFRTMNLRKFSTIKETLIQAYELLMWLFEDNKDGMHFNFAKKFISLSDKDFNDNEILEEVYKFNEALVNYDNKLRK